MDDKWLRLSSSGLGVGVGADKHTVLHTQKCFLWPFAFLFWIWHHLALLSSSSTFMITLACRQFKLPRKNCLMFSQAQGASEWHSLNILVFWATNETMGSLKSAMLELLTQKWVDTTNGSFCLLTIARFLAYRQPQKKCALKYLLYGKLPLSTTFSFSFPLINICWGLRLCQLWG